MVVAFVVSIFAILLGYISQYKNFKFCFPLAFIIITSFLSLGYNWGNDVTSYEYYFERYSRGLIGLFDFNNYADAYGKNEFGWVFLNILFQSWGFYGFRAALFVFENFIVYYFVKKFAPQNYYWLAILIYTLNPFYMVLSSSMMRQWLAMCLVILGVSIYNKKRIFVYLLLIIIAFSIHRSSIICIFFPLYLWLAERAKKENSPFLLFAIIFYYLLSSFIVDYVVGWLNTEDVYDHYSNDTSGVGFSALVKLFLYALLFFGAKRCKAEYRIIMVIPVLYFLILPFMSYSMVASRIGLYYTVFCIAAIPQYLQYLNKKSALKISIIAGVSLFLFYSYYIFSLDPIILPYYGLYRTLFDEGVLSFVW